MLTRSSQETPPKGEGVLITGCSSGIGRATAIHLAQHGYVVFAMVRKEADAEDLRSLDKKRTEPEKVAEIVFKALIAKLPKRQYSIGYLARAASFLEAMPQSVADWILKTRF